MQTPYLEPNPFKTNSAKATPILDVRSIITSARPPAIQQKPQTRGEPPGNPLENARRSSIASSVASSTARADIQEQLLVNRRSVNMAAFYTRLSDEIQLLAN